MASAAAYAGRRLRRGWRSGELVVLALALAVAVSAVSAVNLFTERVRAALEAQTGEALGGDLLFRSRKPLPDTLRAPSAEVRSVDTISFATVVFAGDSSVRRRSKWRITRSSWASRAAWRAASRT